jgi:putative sporulation protein YtxC
MDFTISIPQANAYRATALFHQLSMIPSRLEKLDVFCEISEQSIHDRYFYTLHCKLKRRSQEREVRRVISEQVAHYICETYEDSLIAAAIVKHYPQYDDREREQIHIHTNRLFQKNTHTYFRSAYLRRSERVSKPLFHFLRESRLLAIDGFVHFRLSHYRIALEKCVHDAVDQFLLDQEYQDFISLLKYFVSVQETKMDIVHLIHRDGQRFELCDGSGQKLELNDGGTLQEIVEHSFSHEDLIVSTLLTIAPAKIVLHTKHAEVAIIRTLEQIFETRLIACGGCATCETVESLDG